MATGSLARLHLFPDETTWVVLTGDTTASGTDVPAALAGLAELMLPRLGVVAPLTAMCDLWTPGQVSEALGGERMRIDNAASTVNGCAYEARARRSATQLLIAVGTMDGASGPVLDMLTQSFPQAVRIDLGDPAVPFLHLPPDTTSFEGYTTMTAFVVLDDTTALQIQVYAPDKVDVVAAVQGLLEGSLPVLGSLVTLVPQPSPTPSPVPVGDLADLFPAEIGGSPVDVQAQENQIAGQDPDAVRRLRRQLQRQDRTLDELRLAIGSPQATGELILVVQLPGGRMDPLVDSLLRALTIGDSGETRTISGKEVRIAEDLAGTPYFVYANGDTLWAVSADGAALEEIFQKLP
jgi:hypothetical protein